MVGINSGLISTELALFGGMYGKRNGRESARHGVDEDLDIKYRLIAH